MFLLFFSCFNSVLNPVCCDTDIYCYLGKFLLRNWNFSVSRRISLTSLITVWNNRAPRADLGVDLVIIIYDWLTGAGGGGDEELCGACAAAMWKWSQCRECSELSAKERWCVELNTGCQNVMTFFIDKFPNPLWTTPNSYRVTCAFNFLNRNNIINAIQNQFIQLFCPIWQPRGCSFHHARAARAPRGEEGDALNSGFRLVASSGDWHAPVRPLSGPGYWRFNRCRSLPLGVRARLLTDQTRALWKLRPSFIWLVLLFNVFLKVKKYQLGLIAAKLDALWVLFLNHGREAAVSVHHEPKGARVFCGGADRCGEAEETRRWG